MLEIFSGTKLRGIDEYRNDDDVAHSARFSHQAEMTFVQRAHCRHQPYRAVLVATDFARDGSHALAAIDYLHS
jgi:hypothetical protein